MIVEGISILGFFKRRFRLYGENRRRFRIIYLEIVRNSYILWVDEEWETYLFY